MVKNNVDKHCKLFIDMLDTGYVISFNLSLLFGEILRS